jgi:glyoxylase-like metal-dependent hydrolase (beta-lactamase superfamily II)
MSPASSRAKTFNLGDLECRVLYDGSRSVGAITDVPAERFVFGDAPVEELGRCLSKYGGFGSSTVLPFNYLLLNDGGHYTLVDAGCGEMAENDKHPGEPAGLLAGSLSEAGVNVHDIETVIVSHCHWDHFGGVVQDGEVAFPDAEFVISRREAQYIRSRIGGWALDYLNLIEERVRYVDSVDVLGGGVIVRPAPGHTPGMMVVEVSSSGESLLYTSDVVIHQAHVEHTDWIPSFEYDRVVAAASRLRLVEESHRRGLLLFVPHIPGVLGRVERLQDGYRWAEARLPAQVA